MHRVVRGVDRLTGIAAGAAVAAFAVSKCIYNVDGGQRAVIFNRLAGGVQDKVIGEGTHFVIPWVMQPTIFDVRLRPRMVASRTGTKDLQQVQISLRVLSRPIEEALPLIYKTIGEDFDERVLPSIVNEVLKATVAQFDADQLLTQREKVSAQIREGLNTRAKEFNLLLEDVSITHLVFSKEFTQAIEAKQIAQQEAERSKFVVQRAEQEKRAAIIKAEGEAEAAELISQALAAAGTGVIDIRRIDAAREIAETLASSPNVTYMPSAGVLMNMPVRIPTPFVRPIDSGAMQMAEQA